MPENTEEEIRYHVERPRALKALLAFLFFLFACLLLLVFREEAAVSNGVSIKAVAAVALAGILLACFLLILVIRRDFIAGEALVVINREGLRFNAPAGGYFRWEEIEKATVGEFFGHPCVRIALVTGGRASSRLFGRRCVRIVTSFLAVDAKTLLANIEQYRPELAEASADGGAPPPIRLGEGMSRYGRHILLPLLAPATFMVIAATPVELFGCRNRGLLALFVVFVSLLGALAATFAGARGRLQEKSGTGWWIITASILTLPAVALLFLA